MLLYVTSTAKVTAVEGLSMEVDVAIPSNSHKLMRTQKVNIQSSDRFSRIPISFQWHSKWGVKMAGAKLQGDVADVAIVYSYTAASMEPKLRRPSSVPISKHGEARCMAITPCVFMSNNTDAA